MRVLQKNEINKVAGGVPPLAVAAWAGAKLVAKASAAGFGLGVVIGEVENTAKGE